MRLSVLAAAPLLMASTTLARSPLRRGPATDTCANLDADLVFSDVEIDGQPYDAGHIGIGLCISQVKTFVGHYNVTEAAAKVVGVDKVESTVTAMINKVGVQCTYPPHAKPAVTGSSECDFVCTDGFLAMPPNNPSSCICPPYLTECDGQCGHFRSDCSATPPPSRRQNEPRCAKDLTMCGVPDATWGQAFKCTDVTSDSYTCGGCVKAAPFGSPSTDGVNCHDIPNVDEVSCKDSRCFVQTCKSGFTPSSANNGCIAKPHEKSVRDLPLPGTSRVVDMVDSKELSETTAPGSVVGDKVPRTDAPSDATRQILTTAKATLSGAHSNVPNDVKLPRALLPLGGNGKNPVTKAVGEGGVLLARGIDDEKLS